MIGRVRHSRQIAFYHLFELVLGASLFFVAYWVRGTFERLFPQSLLSLPRLVWILPTYLVIWALLTWLWDAYRAFRSRGLVSHALSVMATIIVSVLGIFSLQTVFKQTEVNRSFMGLFAALHFVGLVTTRVIFRTLLLHATARGYDRHFVLIGGVGDEARSVAKYLLAVPGNVYQVKGFLAEEPGGAGGSLDGIPVMGTIAEIPDIAKREVIDEVYLLPRTKPLEDYRAIILACDEMGVVTHLSHPIFSEVNSRLESSEVMGQPFLTLTQTPRSAVQLALKRTVDLAAAGLLLALLSPLLLLTAILVKLTSRGPVVFRQERLGMNGRKFMLYKFRTMVENAEQLRAELEARNEIKDGVTFKMKSDPRITFVGRILRKTSIDELPQLVNVVKGDMSLVGPRPMLDHEVAKIKPWQRRRMSMRPGITSAWAVAGRNRLTFEEGVKLDLEYIDRWSLWMDMKILLRTIPVVVTGRGAY
jgi:exopolysaccharide biosynthesis polyprenyl glycosylphosphotransferase